MKSFRRGVKITGVGPITPAGCGREAFLRGINEPVSRVREITRFEVGGGPFIGAEVNGFSLRDFVAGVSDRRLPRQTQFALAGAALAARDANIYYRLFRYDSPAVTNDLAVKYDISSEKVRDIYLNMSKIIMEMKRGGSEIGIRTI